MIDQAVDYRLDFPMLSKKMHSKPLIYFDNGATTFKPNAVIKAITDFYQNGYATVHRAVYEIAQHSDDLYHSARKTVQKFIGAQSQKEVVFTASTTDAINKLALSFGEKFLSAGDEILVLETEHHSNLVPWQMAAKKHSAHLKFVQVDSNGDLDFHDLENKLTSKTKLLTLAHVSNVTGAVHPIEEIIKKVREKSEAKVLVDGAQAISHLPIDVQKLDADFYVFSAHKMYGPTGIGVLYGKEALLEEMPPPFGGGDMIEKVELESSTYNELPLKFEAGTPNIAGVVGLKAAIEYLQKVGFDHIEEKEAHLLNYLLEKFSQMPGVQVIAHPIKRSALCSFSVSGVHSLDLATLLNFKGVALRSGHLCAQTALKKFNHTTLLRASFAFYNTTQEIDHFIDALNECISKLKQS